MSEDKVDRFNKLPDEILAATISLQRVNEAGRTSVLSSRWRHMWRHTVDRLSQLPDELLIGILSRLSLKEAGRTSVLSSRWRQLWKYTSRLDLDASEAVRKILSSSDIQQMYILSDKEKIKYIDWVDRILQLHRAQNLTQFRVCLDLCNMFPEAVDEWLEYAFARKVQRLELDFVENGEDTCYDFDNYTFPDELLRDPSLNFRALQALSFRDVNVSDKAIKFFFCNCPLLEELKLLGNCDLHELKVTGPSIRMKYLEVFHCEELKSIVIENTNIVSLKISGVEFLVLQNVPMLTHVSIWFGRNSCKPFTKAFSQLSCCLSQLEVLEFNAANPEKGMRFHKFPELPKVKKLILGFDARRDKSLLGFTSLLKACPCLQEFELVLDWTCVRPSRKKREEKKAIGYTHEKLKVVKISGYFGRVSEIEIVRYFLENAVGLQKLIVDPSDRGEEEIDETARNYAKQQLESLVPSRIDLVIL